MVSHAFRKLRKPPPEPTMTHWNPGCKLVHRLKWESSLPLVGTVNGDEYIYACFWFFFQTTNFIPGKATFFQEDTGRVPRRVGSARCWNRNASRWRQRSPTERCKTKSRRLLARSNCWVYACVSVLCRCIYIYTCFCLLLSPKPQKGRKHRSY